MTRRASALRLAGVALALLAACGEHATAPRSQGSLTVEIEPMPPRVGEARLALELADEQGQPLRAATLRIEATMSHAGMTPEFADAAEVAPGRYETRLEFTMGGDWILLVDATTPDGRRYRWQEDVPNVSSEGPR